MAGWGAADVEGSESRRWSRLLDVSHRMACLVTCQVRVWNLTGFYSWNIELVDWKRALETRECGEHRESSRERFGRLQVSSHVIEAVEFQSFGGDG